MNIGILTGGGDCPGLNAVIRGVTLRGIRKYRDSVVGILDGWQGLVENRSRPLGLQDVERILPDGGTMLGTSRTNPIGDPAMMRRIGATIDRLGLDVVIAVGGDDTLRVCCELHAGGRRTVGVPKTIDNDVRGTDYTFGFQTAVSIGAEAADRLRTTADSHHRFMVLEVMGRDAGWIALEAGMASAADAILIPEFPFDMDELCSTLIALHRRKGHAVIVVAEGAREKSMKDAPTQHAKTDAFGHVMLGGIGHWLAERVSRETGIPARATQLGYIQRGGIPVSYDRVLASRLGIAAADAAHRSDFGSMVALRGEKIGLTPLEEAVREPRLVDLETYEAVLSLLG